MALALHHLGESDVREAMVLLWSAEWAALADDPHRTDCYGKALTDRGWEAFGEHMSRALASEDDDWLCDHMRDSGFWLARMPRRTRSGGMTTYAVPQPESCQRLCVGEFNRAYVRGLAYALMDRGETHAVVYRAGDAMEPRSRCSEWEGQSFLLQQIIDGHRANYWPAGADRSAWSVPIGVNCHHSIRAVITGPA